ncbi:protein MIZU-KUSSEI 1-like, partial [Andrographis paniculata]|uniref:protein MIZU-KUSSEI 1-like n=1 Tax=Andrographis paniculata TaxID=175694 RepID=UPI0021E93249
SNIYIHAQSKSQTLICIQKRKKKLLLNKMEALRRFLLPCLRHTAAAPTNSPAVAKKRLSSSLRVDLDDNDESFELEHSPSSSSSTSPTTTTAAVPYAPPRPSRTMVIGTIFGHRRGRHVFFCIQLNRLTSRPALLLELSIPISTLIHEMRCGLVRIALEFTAAAVAAASELSHCPLRSIPLWTLYCNGKKLGFAVRRKATPENKAMLKTMRSITVGAGMIPGCGYGSGSGEISYIRANYECVVGNADSESFHLINPDEGPGQELSVFLLRSR